MNKINQLDVKYNKEDYSTFLGSGGFAELFLGLLQDHKNIEIKASIPVALKFCKRLKQDDGYACANEQLLAEADILSKCSTCPTIIHSYGTLTNSEISLILELGLQSLYQLLYQKDSKFSIDRIPLKARLDFKLTIAADCIRGLEFLHSLNISHNDIKSDNVMLFPDGYFKLIDLGLAKPVEKILSRRRSKSDSAALMPEPAVHCKGNPSYQAPEMFLSPPIRSAASDVYGFAILVNEILTEAQPMHDTCSVAMHPLQVCGGARPKIIQQYELQQYIPYIKESNCIEEVTKRLQHLIRTGWDPQMKNRPLAKAMNASLSKLIAGIGDEFRPSDMIAKYFYEQEYVTAESFCGSKESSHPPSPTSVSSLF